jgi:hypothetical protein
MSKLIVPGQQTPEGMAPSPMYKDPQGYWFLMRSGKPCGPFDTKVETLQRLSDYLDEQVDLAKDTKTAVIETFSSCVE